MKRVHILIGILAISLVGATVLQAQSPAPGPPNLSQERLRELVQGFQARSQQGAGGRGAPGAGLGARRIEISPWLNGAWWTNTNLVTRLGLTDDQKTKIEKTFENHRQ